MGVKVTLKALRVNNGLNQEQAAELVGVNRMTWYNWENHRTNPDSEQIDSILKKFNVDYNDVNFLRPNPV